MPRTSPELRKQGPVLYLIGTSGHPNFGDELITAAWLRYYAKVLPHATIWLDTPRPGPSAALLSGIHAGLRCVDTLYHASWNAPSKHPAEVLEHGERVIREPGLIPREVTGIENLAKADVVHILGGGYLNNIWPHHLAILGAASMNAHKNGSRTAITGAGLTPSVPDSEDLIGPLLSRFDVVDVRDEPSHKAIAQYVPHATCTSDDSFLDLSDDVYKEGRSTRTAVSIQSDLLETSLEELADYVVRTLEHWKVANDPITVIECMPPDDSVFIPLIAPHIPKLQPIAYDELWRDGFPSELGQRWITTRLHTHILAAAKGSRGLAIPTGDYYRTKHQAVAQLGSDWAIANDLTTPVDVDPRPRQPFGGKLEEIQQAKRTVASQVLGLV